MVVENKVDHNRPQAACCLMESVCFSLVHVCKSVFDGECFPSVHVCTENRKHSTPNTDGLKLHMCLTQRTGSGTLSVRLIYVDKQCRTGKHHLGFKIQHRKSSIVQIFANKLRNNLMIYGG